MRKFNVLYNDIVIGEFSIGKMQEYIPNMKGIEELEKEGIKLLPMLKKKSYQKKFSLLYNLVKDCERFNGAAIDSNVMNLSMQEI